MPDHKLFLRKALLWPAIPVLTTLNQICMKMLAEKLTNTPFGLLWLHEASGIYWFWGIVFCEIASFIIWMKILSVTDISRAVPITGVSYILILLSSWFILHEQIQFLQLLGSSFILAGVWMIGTAQSKTS